jgi:hypothetical protein
MAFCRRAWKLNPPAYSAGGSAKIWLNDLPPGRVEGILVRLTTNIVQAAGAVLIPGAMLVRMFARVSCDKWVTGATGRFLQALNWSMRGFVGALPDDVPAAAATYSRTITIYVPFADYGAFSPLDTAVSCDLIRSHSLDLNWGDPTSLFGANTSFATTSVTATAFLEKAQPDVISAEPVIGYVDWASQSAQIPGGGAYTHLFVYSETSDALTSLGFATMNTYIDGDNICPNLTAGEILQHFNLFTAGGTSYQSAAAGLGGEILPNMPAAAAAAGQTITFPWLPLIVPAAGQSGYMLGHVPKVKSMVRVDWTGTATTATFGFRRVNYADDASVDSALRASKVTNPSEVARGVVTAGAGRITSDTAAVIPVRVSMTAEQRRALGGQ